MDRPIDVLHEFPVRKTKRQKKLFREAVVLYARNLGYESHVEQGSLGVNNIVLGDPEKASYLITAHYDTCARLPFPNLITPCNLLLFCLWQVVLCLLLGIPAGVFGGVLGGLMQSHQLVAVLAYLFLLAELGLMLVGPANAHNANDNTSGVVTLLETAAALPQELRSKVCFVLFDLEEAGLLGSASYRKAHRAQSSRQLVINLDCVGDGDEILLFPTAGLKKSPQRMEKISKLCARHGNKQLLLRERGFAFYPSDQKNFPHALGIAALRRSKWAGLYLNRIHTSRDTNFDEKNIALLRQWLISALANEV